MSSPLSDSLREAPTPSLGSACRPHAPVFESEELVLDGSSLTWADVERLLAGDPCKVVLSEVAATHMRATRTSALQQFEENPALRVYGWNQALGPLKDRPLSPGDQLQFQKNILLSHHAGVGKNLPAHVARLALVIRANSLARGTAGVRPEMVQRILDVVNCGAAPLMPDTGSMGTGDLQPMAAAGLYITGVEGTQALCPNGDVHTAQEIFTHFGVEPTFEFAAGEAIALISGSAVLSASLANALAHVSAQVDTFLGGFALFAEATRAEKQAFDVRMHRERHIPDEERAAQSILALIADSRWSTFEGRERAGELAPRVQDATSVRSVPHQLASILQEMSRARLEIEREINASTCNPILLPTNDGGYEFLAGGNWDATVLGHVAHTLNVCLTRLAVLSKDLSGRLIYEGWNFGLPASLAGGVLGLNSGMTLLHSTGAALIPEMQVRANPVGTLSFPIKGGQEDHNTMAMAAVHNLESNIRRFNTLLAVLVLMGAQGIYLLAPTMGELSLGTGSGRLYAQLREQIAPLDEDRVLTHDLATATALVASGALARCVREALDYGLQANEGGFYAI